jgi:NSS family neurotransmitter:Na+ symporter
VLVSLLATLNPLGFLHRFADSSFFSVVDSLSNIFLPVGALLTSVFLGWFVGTRIPPEELEPMSPSTRRALLFSLRWICPLAILAVLIAAFV